MPGGFASSAKRNPRSGSRPMIPSDRNQTQMRKCKPNSAVGTVKSSRVIPLTLHVL